MRLNLTYLILAALTLAAPLSSCSHNHKEGHEHYGQPGHEHAGEPGHEHAGEAASAEESEGHSHEGLIVLTEEQLSQLGVRSEEILPSDFSDVIKVSGEITSRPGAEGIVSARQSGIVRLSPGISEGMSVNAGRAIASVTAQGMAGGDPNEGARVAYAAAKREVERMTPLHKEGIVTTRDYNEALARMEQAKAALGSAASGVGSAATAPVSGVITSLSVVDGQYVDAGQQIAAISSNTALSLRADVPENSARLLGGITGARFRPSYSDEITDVVSSGGSMISKPSAASAVNGYIPVYFSLPGAGADHINGSYCEVYLLGNTLHGILSVPEQAVSEQQGEYFIYKEHSPGHYRKQPVTIGRSDGLRREIRSGLSAGEKVVTEGMTFVRLAETSGVMPEGHSHNH